jgi:hypothetical protein
VTKPTICENAGIHSSARSAWTFLTINAVELQPAFDVDAAERLVLDVATATPQSIDTIAAALPTFAM